MILSCCTVWFWVLWSNGYLFTFTTKSLAYQSDLLNLAFFLCFVFFAVILFSLKGHYSYSRRKPFWEEIRDILTILFQLSLLNLLIVFLTATILSRPVFMATWLLTFLLVPILRVLAKRALIHMGFWLRPTVIIGWNGNAIETAYALQSETLMASQLIAFLAPCSGSIHPSHIDLNGQHIPVHDYNENLDTILNQLGNPYVVVALESLSPKENQLVIQRLSIRCNNLSIFPSLRGLPLYGMETSHFFSHEVLMLQIRNNLGRRGTRIIKRLFDIAVSITCITLLLPLFAYIAIKIRQSGHQILFKHKRVGQNGRHFLCYKFRSMVPNAEEVLRDLLTHDAVAKAEWAVDFKLKNDPRITPIGAFLRQTSLDELPQLFNVLKGEMSLVGPRPIIDAELERYGDQVDFYLEAKPGITGLWQISGRNDVSYNTRVTLDTWYVKNWALFYDIVILLKTIKVVLKKDGAY